jgi:hypothetical protein
MRVVVLQSNYLPWKGYFDLIHDADLFIFYDEVKYTKNDWRNRNRIYSKNGLQWFTIPIAKNAVKLKISDVSITNKDWREQHFDMMYYAYKRAPHFLQLEELMTDLYKKKDWENLSELNQYAIKKISTYLGIATKFKNSREFLLKEHRIERLIDLLVQAGATKYISGAAAKSYLHGNEHLFSENKIELTYKEYQGYQEYRQLKTPFEHYVSIVDLIANISKEEIPNYIWGYRTT